MLLDLCIIANALIQQQSGTDMSASVQRFSGARPLKKRRHARFPISILLFWDEPLSMSALPVRNN